MPAYEFEPIYTPLEQALNQTKSLLAVLEPALDDSAYAAPLLSKESMLELVKQHIKVPVQALFSKLIELDNQLFMGFGEQQPVFLHIVNKTKIGIYQKLTVQLIAQISARLDNITNMVDDMNFINTKLQTLETALEIMLGRIKFIEMTFEKIKESRYLPPEAAEIAKKYLEGKEMTEQDLTNFFKKPIEYKATQDFKNIYDVVNNIPEKEFSSIIDEHFSSSTPIEYQKKTGTYDMHLEGNKEKLINLINGYKSSLSASAKPPIK